MENTGLDINARVKLQYEAYPYPDYSLYIPLRTQEAYASNSIFSAQLLKERGRIAPVIQQRTPRVLIAGSGDILPFILSFWEPESHQLHALDISEKNIQRARFRSVFRPHSIYWQVGNIEDKSHALPESLSHVDSYGVLHHLANPSQALQRLHDLMLPGATMRVMVYNNEARTWLRHVQKALAGLGLNPYDRNDLDLSVKILKRLMAISPSFAQRMTPMTSSVFNHTARFVDTFFHAREARLGINFWLESFAKVGFETIGLFDRYAELDDLKNPLLQFPTAKSLDLRAKDRRFENNYEIYLTKFSNNAQGDQAISPTKLPTRFRMRMPPKAWFSYSETNSISVPLRFKLWWNYLKTLEGNTRAVFDRDAIRLKPEALQRLARVGAVFPSNFDSQDLRNLIMAPIHGSMDQPSFAQGVDIRSDPELKLLIDTAARLRGRSADAVTQVYRRLEAAQKP